MESLYKINRNSKAIDIFKDSDFLRLFKIFILKYAKDNLEDENIVKLYNQFKEKDFLENFQSKNSYNLFLQFEKFFSDSLNLTIFLEFLKNYNIDEKWFNVFLEVGEFLENVSLNKGEYPKEFYSISDDYNTKIVDIIGKNTLENIKFVLAQENYPLISPFGFEIINADFSNGINYNTLTGIDRFIWCVDAQNNIFYQNTSGEILKDAEEKRVINIDVNSIKNFGEYRIYSFTNEDGEKKIQIELELSLGVNFNNNISGDSFNIKSVSFIEYIENGDETMEKEEKLEFLLINEGEEKKVLDKNLEEISVLDLLLMLNKNNPLVKDNLEKTLSRLSEISVMNIYKIYQFYGIKFIEIEAELPIGYDDYGEEIYEQNRVILLDNGKPLVDKNDFGNIYIYSLGEINDFFGKEFISFSLTFLKKIDGYIDAFGRVLEIKGKKLLKIEKIFTFKQEEFYRINEDNNFIISKTELLKELDNYDAFNESENKIEIGMDNGEYIEINGNKYEKIIVNLGEKELKIYLQYGFKKEAITYKDLIKSLKTSTNGRKALNLLNTTLSLIDVK